jgi:hypothetical protein
VDGGGGGRGAFFAAGFLGAAFAFVFVFAFGFGVAAFFGAVACSSSTSALSSVLSRLRFLVGCGVRVSGMLVEAEVASSETVGSSVDGKSMLRTVASCDEASHRGSLGESDVPDGLAIRAVSPSGVQTVVVVSEVRAFSSNGGTIVDGAEERGEVSCDEKTRGGVFGAIFWPAGVEKESGVCCCIMSWLHLDKLFGEVAVGS